MPHLQQGRDRALSPFCSKRCADLDLGRWFAGDYRIAALEPPDESDLDDIDWDNVSAFPDPGER